MSLFDSVLAGKLAGGTGTSSWNDIKDKPFGETLSGGDTLTWDGNTEGLTSAMGVIYKVSDAIFTMDDISGGYIICLNTGEEIHSGLIEMMPGAIGHESGMVVCVSEEAVGVDIDGIQFEEAGVYFYSAAAAYVSSLTIPGYTGFPSVKTLDPKYLPMDDIIAAVKAAMEA